MKTRRITITLLALMITASMAMAELRTSQMFSDNMVLQRERDVPVWGWADKGATITVEFGGQKVTAAADDAGKWKAILKPMKANAESQVLTITSSADEKKLELKNVVVGDVWICSGQSNMEWYVSRCANPGEEAKAANYPLIRHIKIRNAVSVSTKDDVATEQGQWNVCTPKTAPNFTAVGYYFGRKLHEELNVPIGLIASNWGGTRVEPWIPKFAFGEVAELKDICDQIEKQDPASEAGKANNRKQIENVVQWVEAANKAVEEGKHLPGVLPKIRRPKFGTGNPTAIYNAMIHPMVGYGIRGAIWYQGESNGNEGISYFHKKKALITGWRELWGYDFPFYFVQLANFQNANNNPAGGDGYARIREAQRKTLEIPKTGMAVIIDIGEARDIHPKNKQDVGKRLARWALADEHGKKIVKSGPLFKEMEIKDGKAIISFDHIGKGLMVGEKAGLEPTKEVEDGKLKRFAVAGADKKWVWADAEIKGETVIVSSPEVAEPVAVRYAFSMNPEGCNLYNKEGLPASPFRTDDW